MELDEYLLALRKRWFIIAVLAVVCGALGFLYARSITPTYSSSATVFVAVNEGSSPGELVQGSTFVQNAVSSFSRLASMPVVLAPVIEKLGLNTTPKSLANSVSADTPLNSMILVITTTDTNPARAADISNAVANQLSVTVKDLSPRTTTGSSSIELSVIAPAVKPEFPFKPNTRFLTATGIAVGLGLGVTLALLLTVLDTRVRTRADLERISGLPVLGAIIRVKSASQANVTMRVDPTSPRAEAFRRLQANLQYLQTERPLSAIVVTSALSAEGKTSTSVNLAMAVAEKGGKVLLIDADLRRPTVASAIGIEGGVGLTTVLIGRATLDEVVQPWAMDNLHVLPSGEQPPNPSQLLDSAAMHQLIDDAIKAYDLVIIDSPPILPVIDAAVLGRHTDGVLLVVRMRKTRRQQVQAALAALERVDATRLGLVATSVVDDGTGPAYGYVYKQAARERRWRKRRLPAPAHAGPAHEVLVAHDTAMRVEWPPKPVRLSEAGAPELADHLRRVAGAVSSGSIPPVEPAEPPFEVAAVDGHGDAVLADDLPQPHASADEDDDHHSRDDHHSASHGGDDRPVAGDDDGSSDGVAEPDDPYPDDLVGKPIRAGGPRGSSST
jgi:polysaccharide biosynthesis transport protein